MNPNSFNNPAANSSIPMQNYRPVPTAPLNPPPPSPAPRSGGGIIKTVLLIFFVLTSLVAGYFIYYFYNEYTIARTDVDAQIAEAVAKAEKDKTSELEAEFAEREKNPYSTFSGPADYGELTFNYPKTWSVYISDNARDHGDFHAFLNPSEVNPVSDETINALRVSILDRAYEETLNDYKDRVENEENPLKSSVIQINGQNATLYQGKITDQFVGAVAIFKLRDKTVLLQTDAEIFFDDFNRILETVKYNS